MDGGFRRAEVEPASPEALARVMKLPLPLLAAYLVEARTPGGFVPTEGVANPDPLTLMRRDADVEATLPNEVGGHPRVALETGYALRILEAAGYAAPLALEAEVVPSPGEVA